MVFAFKTQIKHYHCFSDTQRLFGQAQTFAVPLYYEPYYWIYFFPIYTSFPSLFYENLCINYLYKKVFISARFLKDGFAGNTT